MEQVHNTLAENEFQLLCTDITEDDEGCARFQVNSMIPADDDDATMRASALIDGAADLLKAAKVALEYLKANPPKGKIRDTNHFANLNNHVNGITKPLWEAIEAIEGGES